MYVQITLQRFCISPSLTIYTNPQPNVLPVVKLNKINHKLFKISIIFQQTLIPVTKFLDQIHLSCFTHETIKLKTSVVKH